MDPNRKKYGPRLISNVSGQTQRVESREVCTLLENCGSCALINQPYRQQLVEKNRILKDLFAKAGPAFARASIGECAPSPLQSAYRNAVRLTVGEQYKQGKKWIDLGFYKPQKNQVVDIGRCPVQSDALNDLMAWLRSGIRIHQISVFSPTHPQGLLKNIVIRSSLYNRECFIIFVTTENNTTLLKQLGRDIAQKFSAVKGVFAQIEDRDGQQGAAPILLVGQDRLEERVGEMVYTFAAAIDLPVNPPALAPLYERISTLCEASAFSSVIHLHGGNGILSTFLARLAKKMVVLESSSLYRAHIQTQLQRLHMTHVRVEDGSDLYAAVEKLSTSSAESGSVACVISSTKRGEETRLLKLLAQNKSVQKIVYHSSYLEDMMRDIQFLVNNGYQLVHAEGFDCLPGTLNIEVVCVLEAQLKKN